MLGIDFFLFLLKILFHCLVYMVLYKTSTITFIFVLLCLMWPFSLPVSNLIFLFTMNFEQHDRNVPTYHYISISYAYWIYNFIVFIKLRKFLATISSNVVFCHTISLLPYVDANYVHIPHKLDHLKLSHNFLMLFSFIFYYLYLLYFILDS